MRTTNQTSRRLVAFIALLALSLVFPTSSFAAKKKRKSKTKSKMDQLVDDYAQAFRVQVYEGFSHDRQEYNWRIAKGKEAVKLYNKLESPVKKKVIIGWFQLAMESSRPNSNTCLLYTSPSPRDS